MEGAPSQQEGGLEEYLVKKVDKWRRKVKRLERELKDWEAQEARLLLNYSFPLFPHGATAAVPGKEKEDCHRQGAAQAPDAAGVSTETLSSSSDEDRAATTSRNVDALKDEMRRERPAANGVKKPSPAKPTIVNLTRDSEKKLESSDGESESSDEESSDEGSEVPEESSDSDDDESEDAVEAPDGKSEEALEASDDSSSSDSDSDSMEPMKKPSPEKSPAKVKSPVVRKPEIAASSSSSEESSSSSEDEDDAGIQRPTGRASLGRAKEPQVPKAVPATSLSPNALPEDLFDSLILGFQGPWAPPQSMDVASKKVFEPKDQALPLKFSSMAAYTEAFQKLITEEAKASLKSEWEEWEKYKAKQESNAESSVDYRGQSSLWRLQSMVQTIGDPFHYFVAECIKGQNVRFAAQEVLCMIDPATTEVKAVAIQDRSQPRLLKTLVPWDCPLDKCVLLGLYNMVTLHRMFLAVSNMSEIHSPLCQQILNPLANRKFLKPHDDDPDQKLSSESLRNFSNRKILNTLQLLTVSSLLHMRQGFQLVQGPPGTGKTSTVVGMVSALLIEEPGTRILICAPSNAALDELADRFMRQMLDKSGNTFSPMDGFIVRFGDKSKMHPLVQSLSLDSLSNRLSSGSHRSRADILESASIVCATLSGCGNATFDELEKKFDVVIIDEAAQAVEPEVLIALQRVRGRCVMVGDPQQLPATVKQQPSTAYSRSLFERFQEAGVPVHILTTQYRMHPSICSYPSRKFYKGALKNSRRTTSMHSIFSPKVCTKGVTIGGCRFKLGHYTFMDVGWSIEEEELVGHSRANREEARVVCNVVEGAVKSLLPGRKPNFGVITPYTAQRGLIEPELKRRGIDPSACEVNTVDGFQGREKDVIVLSCVRAMADKGLGFVKDERRMNVALTRAKYSLIIVGHAETLQNGSPAWGGLIEDAMKRGCYQVLANNSKSPHILSRNWKASSSSREDTAEVEHPEPTTADKSTKNVKGKAKKVENDTQKARDEEAKVKRKRKSADGENASPTVKKKKGKKATESSPDLSKKKKKQKKKIVDNEDVPESSEKRTEKKPKVNEDVPESSGNRRKKKPKVDGDMPESSDKKRKKSPEVDSDVVERKGKRIHVKEEPEQEFPVEKGRQGKSQGNFVICLPAPAFEKKGGNSTAETPKWGSTTAEAPNGGSTTAETRKGGYTTAEAPGINKKQDEAVQLKTPKVEVPEPEPESSTRARIVETPLKATVKQEEGVTSAAPEIKPQIPVQDPIPQERDRNAATEMPSRGWFQNTVPEPDRHSSHNNHQLPPTNVRPGSGRFDEHGVSSSSRLRQAHWGNSYEVPHEANMTTDQLNNVLSRANHYLMQPNHFQQEPRNHWQLHMGNQFGAHHEHFQNPDHRHHHQQPPLPGPHFNGGSNSHPSSHWRGRGRGGGRRGGRFGGRHP